MTMIDIDGSGGEGGGQILRTSLALALATGRVFRISGIRAKRSKPGLLRQHLTCVQAARKISDASVSGAELGSRDLVFEPGTVKAGEYEFAIGAAGSTTLVLQTVLLALVAADGPSRVVLEGGTHNSAAPPFEFLRDTFLPLLARMGAKVELRIERHGFYPAGGGRIVATIQPAKSLTPISLVERGPIRSLRAMALIANLAKSIAAREILVLREAFANSTPPLETDINDRIQSPGPGNIVSVAVQSDALTETLVGFGEAGVQAESVATRLAESVREYIDAGAPVGRHLADQLLLPLALAGGGEFTTLSPTEHTRTNAAVIERFLPVAIGVEREAEGVWKVAVRPR